MKNTVAKFSCFLFIFCVCTERTLGQSDRFNPTASSTTTASTTTTTGAATTTTAAETTSLPKRQNARQRLRDFLVQDHEPNVHPIEDVGQAVVVKLGMAVIHFDVDEYRSVLSVDAWMRMAWNDNHLKWDPKDFDNLTQIHFGEHELWRPDIQLYNSAEEASIDPFGNVHFLVDYTGDVLWVPPAHFKAFCKLNLRYWPFDEQTCTLKFGSWTSHGEQIDLELYRNFTEAEMLNMYTENREWKIKGKLDAKKRDMKYSCCVEHYPDVTFTFNLIRDSPAYRSIIVLPCLVIMLMTGSSFLLTPQSGEKLIINGFAIIGSFMFLIYFANTLPFHSSEVPIIVTFFSNTAALIGIAILLNVVCIGMAREKKYSSPPKMLKNFFSGFGGRLLCLGNYTHQVSSTHQRLVVELDDLAESEQQTETGNGDIFRPSRIPHAGNSNALFGESEASIIMRDWIMIAAGIERMFFLVYAIGFAIITSVYV